MKTAKRSHDCVKMFELTRLPYLINAVALEHYRHLDVIAVYRDHLWTTFMSNDSYKRALSSGLGLFGNDSEFGIFESGFEEYKERSSKFFEKIRKAKRLTREDAEQMLDLVAEHWKYYQKTEFFYVDDAFKQKEKDAIIRKNLKRLEGIKTKGRIHMNSLIFGDDCHLSTGLSKIGEQLGIGKDDLFWMSRDEILMLFDGNKIDREMIEHRKQNYVFMTDGRKVLDLHGNDAKEFIDDFIVTHKDANEWKGVTANPGRIKGRVKKILGGADSYDKLHKKIDEMQQGDILVADTTSPELILACQKASAILTNQGGLLSHAAIVSRELNIPCIVGLGNITHVLNDADMVEVDATMGIVRKI